VPATHSTLQPDLKDVPHFEKRAVTTVFPPLWCSPPMQGACNTARASGTQNISCAVWLLCC